jgi:hypothetical protein
MSHVGSLEQVASVTPTEVLDGSGRGVRLLQVRNAGLLAFDVLLDRASDVGRVDAHGRPVAFWSRVGFAPPWRWLPGEDMDGLLRAFSGGLFTTCGLDHIGHPEQDPPPSGDGRATGRHFPVHGRVTGVPATLRGHGVDWDGDECDLWVETEVRQAAVYGENLVLRRRITTRLGEPTIQVEDRVTNEGFRPDPHMLMYHCNLGFPLLSPGGRLAVDPGLAVVDGPEVPDPFPEPDPAWQTRLQQLRAPVDSDRAEVGVSSASGRVRVGWGTDSLPYVMLWQQFEAGSYALGVQPSTNLALGRDDARGRGELRVLQPGESVTHRVTFDFAG